MSHSFSEAIDLIKKAKHIVAFTGAGISVESGIPPFRGAQGLWSKYDPQVLELYYFFDNPKESWTVIKEIFYDFFGKAKPNDAHKGLAILESKGFIKEIITQNIDNLHQEAGSKVVYEFHGNSQQLICTSCKSTYKAREINLNKLPPLCLKCNSLLKPNFIFFGEGIPQDAYHASLAAAKKADLFILIGTTGEVMPACQMPYIAKENGAKIIEINPETSKFTHTITDVILKEKASIAMNHIIKSL
ncbi:MAG: NAD-dependent deacylase [Bacteroidetes bacterium]|nr:NAD-dependent deacylase [Bacteroidota bacterium]